MMVSFIDEHRHAYGVEPICAVLPIAPSTYYAWLRQRGDPASRAARVQRDEVLQAAIRRSWAASQRLYGARKVWRVLSDNYITPSTTTTSPHRSMLKWG